MRKKEDRFGLPVSACNEDVPERQAPRGQPSRHRRKNCASRNQAQTPARERVTRRPPTFDCGSTHRWRRRVERREAVDHGKSRPRNQRWIDFLAEHSHTRCHTRCHYTPNSYTGVVAWYYVAPGVGVSVSVSCLGYDLFLRVPDPITLTVSVLALLVSAASAIATWPH